ncbi:hypothetical protein CLV58_11620 [Spirosoma oryzae]|uniref:Uncharacterized protein n=1 Tax=Spirosoma oryzae TaxID=1469603 RepID=A0A2T0SMI4_9BACT|nr:hypothetical protein [Spirosoma oryzae]PRY34627.1 hypothetical protein CLV58_11620 [Spirosoma oryzae]
MNTYQLVAFGLALSRLKDCSSSSDKHDPLLDEAARYHNEATVIQATLEPRVDQIDSLKTVLTEQSLPANAARIATLDSIKTAFEAWEENLVEVPGMSHEHDHTHGKHEHHHHTDATLKDLPADQMRDLQRETLNSIRQLQDRFDAVVTQTSRSGGQ